MPRARLQTSEGGTTEWHSKALRTYQRRTLTADALIAGAYLAGTNTRRVRRALAALFRGAVSNDIVSRVWREIKSDWDFWSARSLAAEPIVRPILDGTVVRVRLDRKATSVSLLVVIGVREDGQKVMLAVKNMGSEFADAWRSVLDDLIERGLRQPAFLIVDGAPGLEKAIAAVWDGVPVQRCTVHRHRNLLAHAPERLHEEIGADYTDMIYAATPEDIATRRKAFIRKWRLKHRPVADSLEEAGDRLFSFAQLPPRRRGHVEIGRDGSWRTLGVQSMHNRGFRHIGSGPPSEKLLAALDGYQDVLAEVAKALIGVGYWGPAGVNSMLLTDGTLVPILEINARRSLGLLCMALGARVGLPCRLWQIEVKVSAGQGIAQASAASSSLIIVLRCSRADRSTAAVASEPSSCSRQAKGSPTLCSRTDPNLALPTEFSHQRSASKAANSDRCRPDDSQGDHERCACREHRRATSRDPQQDRENERDRHDRGPRLQRPCNSDDAHDH